MYAVVDADPGWVFTNWEGYCGNRGDGNCGVSERQGEFSSTARFREITGRGRLGLAVQGPGQILIYTRGSEQVLCPGSCVQDLARLRGADRNSYFIADPTGTGRFADWEGCDDRVVLTGEGRARGCLVREALGDLPANRLLRAVFAHPPSVRYSISGRGTLFFDGNRDPCSESCVQSVPAPGAITARPQPRNGWFFHHWGGACERAGDRCTLRDLPERIGALAVFRERGTIRVRIRGRGSVYTVLGPRGEEHGRFLDQDQPRRDNLTCDVGETCVLPLLEPGQYRAFRAEADEGWRFSHYEGYCASVFRPRECHVDGGDHRTSTTAVFVPE